MPGDSPARWPILVALLSFVLAQGTAAHHFATIAHEGGACHLPSAHSDGVRSSDAGPEWEHSGRLHAGGASVGSECPLAPFVKNSPDRFELRGEVGPRLTPGAIVPRCDPVFAPWRESRYRLAPKTSPPHAA